MRDAAAATELPAWSRAVRDLGFPVVVSCFLVWQSAIAWPAAIERILGRMESLERAEATKAHALEQQAAGIAQLVGRIDAILLQRPR